MLLSPTIGDFKILMKLGAVVSGVIGFVALGFIYQDNTREHADWVKEVNIAFTVMGGCICLALVIHCLEKRQLRLSNQRLIRKPIPMNQLATRLKMDNSQTTPIISN